MRVENASPQPGSARKPSRFSDSKYGAGCHKLNCLWHLKAFSQPSLVWHAVKWHPRRVTLCFQKKVQASAHDDLAGIEIEADIVEPFGDEVFVAGVPYVGIIEQQNRGPVD
jgi:hypothetical protein